MEVVIKNALQTLTGGDARLDPSKALGLQDRLMLVDEKFALLRKEISRLNMVIAEEKDKNSALEVKCQLLAKELVQAKESSSSKVTTDKKTPKKKAKKKTTKKK